MELILEIGPGEHPIKEASHTLEWPMFKWGQDRIPFGDESFDVIYASHVLEHVPWFQTHQALSECYRVTFPLGSIEIWVPDFLYLVECYMQGALGDNWRKHNENNDPMVWLNGRLFTYGPDPNWHRAVFDEPYLGECLLRAGYVDIERLENPRGYDHGEINLGVRGWKPE